jgi:hypothetical protein
MATLDKRAVEKAIKDLADRHGDLDVSSATARDLKDLLDEIESAVEALEPEE